MAGSHDLNTPQGRFRASQALGTAAYNTAMREHIAHSVLERVNGYPIRPVPSPFGRLYAVGIPTIVAFASIEQARTHARGLPAQAEGRS